MVLVVEPVAGAHAEGDGVAASETTLRALFAAAGFRQLRHVADAPLHRVYAVRG